MKAPCKGCSDRHPICHDSCPKYQAYKQEREEIRNIKAEKAALSAIRGARIEKQQHEWIMKRKREGR